MSWMHRIHNVTTLLGGGAVGRGWTVPGEESLIRGAVQWSEGRGYGARDEEHWSPCGQHS